MQQDARLGSCSEIRHIFLPSLNRPHVVQELGWVTWKKHLAITWGHSMRDSAASAIDATASTKNLH